MPNPRFQLTRRSRGLGREVVGAQLKRRDVSAITTQGAELDPNELQSDLGDQRPEKPTRSRSRRRLIITLIVIGVVAVLGIATGAGLLAARLTRAGTEVTGEWQQRIAKDYPEWKMVGFNFRSFSGSNGSQTDYTISVVPPDRDFAVGILYVSRNDGEAACKDEVLRPGGLYSTRSEALLDYIEDTYVADAKSVTSVITERNGSVTVNWLKVNNYWVFSSNVGSFDVLEYDPDTDSWDVASSPDIL